VSDQDTIGTIAYQIASAFQPLADVFATPSGFATFMEQLGWEMTAVPPALAPLGDAATQFRALLPADGSDPSIPPLLAAIVSFAGAVNGIASQPSGNFPSGLDVATFKAEFPQQLIDTLVIDHLGDRLGGWGTLLTLAGVIRVEDVAASGSRPEFIRRSIAWADLGNTLNAPAGVAKDAYLWGQPGFRGATLLGNLGDALDALSISSQFATIDPGLFGTLTAGALDPQSVFPTALQLPFFEEPDSGVGGSAGLEVLILPQTSAKSGGFAILPYLQGNLSQDIQLDDTLTLQLRGAAGTAGLIAVVFRPGDPVALATGAPASSGAFSFGLVTQAAAGAKTLLFGTPGASRLEYESLGLLLGFRAEGSAASLFVEASLAGGALAIEPGAAADGFLSQFLPSNISADLDLTLGFDTKSGLYFRGSGGLEIQLPLHVSLGPIDITSATISVRPKDGAVPIGLGVGIDGALGPLQATVDNVGLNLSFTFPGHGGNLGPLDLALGFRPPNGVGLSIDLAVVTGGGFLSIDTDRGRYAGILQLTLAGFLSVTAIGLIDTKLPDGSDGFSLLILITADFGPGIQLGFGFTLLAVGGLLGLNRGMNFQAIMDGVRTNAITSVMFPTDVIANATRIISDLRAFFPPHPGTFLIGPMLKIGWGEPTLASISVGVIIEIPPGDIAILGVIRLALPAEDIAILVLQVNFAGAIEVDKQRIYFFAALFDSHVLFITIDGSMGLLIAYGDNANFVVSVGGFHPQFTPPPLPFPPLQRISINLINESFARIHADGYFAVTSNTVQFGTHSDYYFGFSALNVQGASSFDALIQFSPFHFSVSFSTSFSVNVSGIGMFGIGIALTVEGPTPWHASGTASLSFFFFSIDIGIDFTWGDSRNTTLPPVAVMPLLVAELGKLSNWRALLPPGNSLLVSLRHLDAAEAALVLHPVGTLQISQRLVPLDLTLDRFGSQTPSDANLFALDVTSPGLTKTRNLQNEFAPSQFQNFSDAQKLSQQAYEPFDSGLELSQGGVALATGPAITRNVRYDVTVIDTRLRRVAVRFFGFPGLLFRRLLQGGAISRSPLSAVQAALRQPALGQVSLAPETFTIAFAATNQAFAAGPASFTSKAAANDHLQRMIGSDPSLAGSLHVLPQFEVAA
jgi:hypothetical protein